MVFLLILAQSVLVQLRYPGVPAFRHYGPDDGMSHTAVHSLGQGSDGEMWFGTYVAINAFDGAVFHDPLERLGVKVGRIRRIAPDGETMWLATHGGLFRVGHDDIQRWDVDRGLPDSSVYDVVPEPAGVWVATRKGLIRLDRSGDIHTCALAARGDDVWVRCVLRQEDGSLLVGTDRGLLIGDGSYFAEYDRDDGLSEVPIHALSPGPNGSVLAATDDGLYILSATDVGQVTSAQGLRAGSVWAVHLDSWGTLWVGTDLGLSYALADDVADGQLHWRSFPLDHDLGQTTVYAIDQDQEGNLWFGTCVGVFMLEHPGLRNVAVPAQSPAPVLSFWEDVARGAVFVGSARGLFRIDAAEVLHGPIQPESMTDPFIRALAGREPVLYVGTREGVWSLDLVTQTLGPVAQLENLHVLSLYLEEGLGIVVGTLDRGAFVLESGSERRQVAVDQGLPGKRVYAINAGDGRLFLGTDGGLAILDSSLRHLKTVEATLGDEVYAIYWSDRETLWLGTDRGLMRRFRGQWRSWGRAEGLPQDSCYAVTEDARGDVWLATGHGLVRFDGNRFRIVDRSDGLPHVEANIGALVTDAYGQLWLGQYLGLTILDPQRFNDVDVHPRVRFAGEVEAQGGILRRSYRDANLQISLAATAFPRSALSYRFRVLGLTEGWQQTDQPNFSTGVLKPGSYRVRAQARTRDSDWSPQPLELALVIDPPLWATWWFRLLTASGLALVLVFYIRNLRTRNLLLAEEARALNSEIEAERVASLRREAELRLLHAQMNPHFLQNAFANAIYFVRASPEKAEQMMRRLSALFRNTMRAKHDLWTDVASECAMARDYLAIQAARFEDRLSYAIDCPSNLTSHRVPSFVLQPLVENAVIHGFKETLETLSIGVCFRPESDGIRLTVTNNGQPFDGAFRAMIKPGHALDNISKRLELLNQPPVEYCFSGGRHQFSIRVLESP